MELKPCPFCGCKIIFEKSKPGFALFPFSVVCAGCGAQTAWFDQKDRAVKAWNRRVEGVVK